MKCDVIYQLIVAFIVIIQGGKLTVVGDIVNTSPEVFPFHAVVQGPIWMCNGVLIDYDFVLTPASCIYGSKNVPVYLGYQGHPLFSRNEAGSKIYHSNAITIHEDYEYLGDGKYLNNIALIQLSTSITPSNTIRPGQLITEDEAKLLTGGTFLNITGWFSYVNTNLKVAVVKLRSQDACGFLFGRQFFKNQEMCVNWNCIDPLDHVGNPVSLNSKIIGYQTKTPPCLCSSDCSQGDVFFSFIPFLDWISEHMNGETPNNV